MRRFFSFSAQRAAITSSAVESEPPETARRNPCRSSRPRNSASLPRRAPRGQQWPRFCSRSTACFTLDVARGYLRSTSPSEAQAASFSPNAASDWPSRNNASGARPVASYFVETARNDSAASRYCCCWKRLSPSQYWASDARRSLGYWRRKPRNVSRRAHNPCAEHSHRRDRIDPWASSLAAVSPAWTRSNSDCSVAVAAARRPPARRPTWRDRVAHRSDGSRVRAHRRPVAAVRLPPYWCRAAAARQARSDWLTDRTRHRGNSPDDGGGGSIGAGGT